MNLLTPTLPLYAEKIGGGPASAGLIVGIYALTALLFRPYFGGLLDTKGRKIILMIGMTVFLISSLLYNVAFMMVSLLVIRLIQGAGFSATSTSLGTIASDLVPASRRAEGIGYFGMANTIGMAIGPALGLYIITHHNFSILFLMTTVFTFLAFGLSLLLHSDQKFKESELYIASTKEKSTKFSIDSIIERSSIVTCLVLLFIAAIYGSILTFIPSYAAYRGINNIGIFYTVYAAAILFIRLFAGKLADHYGFTKVFVPGVLMLVMSLILLAFAKSYVIFLLVAVLFGLGYGSAQPILNTIVISLSPIDRRGIANATFFSTMDIGIGVGAIVWGMLSQVAGFPVVYGAAAFCGVISLVIYLVVLRKQLKRSNISV